MLRVAIAVVCLFGATLGAKCTNPQNNTTPGEPETTTFIPTTEDFPPPDSWPSGRFSLLRAGPRCPEFFNFRNGWRYQDSEDYLNGNSWPTESRGFPGRMKKDGYEFHYCTKNKGDGTYRWPAGNYCIPRFTKRCPSNDFRTGSITWDDEDSFNFNLRKGSVPNGVYNNNVTKINYCCRDDGDANSAIDLPITRPFYLYRFSAGCQKVRKMTATEEIVQFDDEDTNNINSVSGDHPMDSGSARDHRLHFCLYEAK